ncbi:MAG: zinc-dependent metalloprotease [Arachnia sp.]
MQTLPPIDWELARRVSRSTGGDLPEVTRPEAHALVASLRLAARRAGELVATVSGMPGEPAQRVVVSDRASWARGATSMAGAALDQLSLPVSSGALRGVQALGHGALAGVGLGWVGRQLLGQFDPAASTLYLLAPNIVQLQRSHGFVMADFQLWVAAHEQTHAFQFSAAPWLMDHLMQRFGTVTVDDVSTFDVIKGVARGRGLSASMTSLPAQRALQEVTATMTLLEGHADFVSDKLGPRHIPTVRKLRRAFSRNHPSTALARLIPAADKNSQYRDGLAFCRAVSIKAGRRALNRAYESPENLPRPEEISEPAAWLRRVHGTA